MSLTVRLIENNKCIFEVKARDIIYFLVRGVVKLRRSPETFRKYDSPNGWGTYDNFLPWLESYLAACEKSPNAIIKVYR